MNSKIRKKDLMEIKSQDMWSQEAVARFQFCYQWMLGFATISRIYGKGYGTVVVPFKNNYGMHFLDKKKSIELAQVVISRYLKNAGYIKKIINKWKKERNLLLLIFKLLDSLDLSLLNKPGLLKEYNRLMNQYFAEFHAPLVLEAFEPYSNDIFFRQFQNLGKTDKKMIDELAAPSFVSFLEKYHDGILKLKNYVLSNADLLNIILSCRKNIEPEIKFLYPAFYNKLESFQKKYFWVNNNYKDADPIAISDFIKILKNEIAFAHNKQAGSPSLSAIKRKKIFVLKKINISNENKKIFKLFDILAPWHDERKRLMMMASFYIQKLLIKISKSSSVPMEELYWYSLDEVKNLLLHNKKIPAKLARERQKDSVWVGNNAKDCWLVGAEAKKVKDIIFKKQKQKSRLLTGLPACPGFARGKARIILTAEKAKMQQGEILVVPMTRPEFVPLMKKASAVITNEGGLTCHAAIVSRELRIPCVVGTRIATKVLKDGDEVEVRAHRGEVRIL